MKYGHYNPMVVAKFYEINYLQFFSDKLKSDDWYLVSTREFKNSTITGIIPDIFF